LEEFALPHAAAPILHFCVEEKGRVLAAGGLLNALTHGLFAGVGNLDVEGVEIARLQELFGRFGDKVGVSWDVVKVDNLNLAPYGEGFEAVEELGHTRDIAVGDFGQKVCVIQDGVEVVEVLDSLTLRAEQPLRGGRFLMEALKDSAVAAA